VVLKKGDVFLTFPIEKRSFLFLRLFPEGGRRSTVSPFTRQGGGKSPHFFFPSIELTPPVFPTPLFPPLTKMKKLKRDPL